MNIEHDALGLITRLKELYLEERDIEGLLSCMDECVTWIGTGADEVSRGLGEARIALEKERSEYGGAFRVEDFRTYVIPLSDEACVVYGKLRAAPLLGYVEEQDVRFSAVFAYRGKVLRLLHMHFSRPDAVQEEGHYFVSGVERADNATLRSELENLIRYIPGGANQCRNDADFSLMNMSDGFFSMFGYTRDEVHTLFQDKFINMIVPGDRSAVLHSARAQLQNGPAIDLEYRVLCADGHTMWILDKGRLLGGGTQDECLYCVLIDITQRKQEQEALRLSLERHQVIMDQATDIIFEWDIRADTLKFSPNWYKKFGYAAISETISTRIPLSKNIHRDDLGSFSKLMRDTKAGIPYSETEFRIKNIRGRYFWCRIRATAQYDEEGHAIKAVGVILDIDAEKKHTQALLDQAQRDALTGLYNKATINTLVTECITHVATSGNQALMMIDVDHFKLVNDTFGHLAGDSVLSDVASALKEGVRTSDLVGRIGGDEFLVYLPDVVDSSAALVKAQRILDTLQAISPIPGAGTITCSIGVAVFPHGGIDYTSLCQCADQALYHRKQNGRGGVSFYNKSLCGEAPCGNGVSAVGTTIGSDKNAVYDEYLAQYVFRTLYGSTDMERAIPRILEIVGRAYDVSRAYIFETCPDGKHTSITFEWCAAGITPQMALLQNYSYEEDLGDYQQNFDADGVFLCPDIESASPSLREVLAPQGIHAMLQCASWDDGVFAGGVGFDECRRTRVWSPKQIASFKLTANVLASFVMKLRLKEQLKQIKPL